MKSLKKLIAITISACIMLCTMASVGTAEVCALFEHRLGKIFISEGIEEMYERGNIRMVYGKLDIASGEYTLRVGFSEDFDGVISVNVFSEENQWSVGFIKFNTEQMNKLKSDDGYTLNINKDIVKPYNAENGVELTADDLVIEFDVLSDKPLPPVEEPDVEDDEDITKSFNNGNYHVEEPDDDDEDESSSESVTAKKVNSMKVDNKATITLKARTLRKKDVIIKKPIQVKIAKGKVTFKSGASALLKGFKVKKNGNVIFKKGIYKKGVYVRKVKVSASGNAYYKPLVRTVMLTIKIK